MAAPLRLTNQLPVPGSLLVWEQQAGSKDLVGRQTVQVPTGATVPIHTGMCSAAGDCKTDLLVLWASCFSHHPARLPSCLPACLPPAADMRRVVSFSFDPGGYEWVEPSPTVLSEGLSGKCWGYCRLCLRSDCINIRAVPCCAVHFTHPQLQYLLAAIGTEQYVLCTRTFHMPPQHVLPCREGARAAAAARPLPPRAPQQHPACGGLYPPHH